MALLLASPTSEKHALRRLRLPSGTVERQCRRSSSARTTENLDPATSRWGSLSSTLSGRHWTRGSALRRNPGPLILSSAHQLAAAPLHHCWECWKGGHLSRWTDRCSSDRPWYLRDHSVSILCSRLP